MPIRARFSFFPSRSASRRGQRPAARRTVRTRGFGDGFVSSARHRTSQSRRPPRAGAHGSFSRVSSVTHGQKHGAACHGRPAGDEPGPERARGRARVLRVASGGEGEVQAVLPRGTHAPRDPRPVARTTAEDDPNPTLGLLFRAGSTTGGGWAEVSPSRAERPKRRSSFLLFVSSLSVAACRGVPTPMRRRPHRRFAHTSLTSNPEPRRALATFFFFFFFRRRRCAARYLGSCARTGWRR